MEPIQLRMLANTIRQDIVKMVGAAGSGHPGGSLSCTDVLTALYFGDVLRYDPNDPKMQGRDFFILAKGHAAPALYATLARAGFFSAEELETLRKWGSKLQGHPDCHLVPGVEVSTGSLGQGLSIAAGTAAGLRLAESDAAVFALLGDGECEEGQVWEAAMFAAHNGLDNLVAIVDHNGLQIDGAITAVCNPEDIAAKFEAFGWDTCVLDGHDIEALTSTLAALRDDRSGKPFAVIAQTTKGKGVSYMENQAGWHGKAPKGEQIDQALAELAAEAQALEAEAEALESRACNENQEEEEPRG